MAGLDYEKEFRKENKNIIVGIDEAGRGPLAGPLVVACVILPPYYDNPSIDDSKKLSEKKREELFSLIKEVALDYVIKVVSVEEIDASNIYKVTQQTMEKIVEDLKIEYDAILTDAMPLPNCQKPYKAIIKGDSLSQNIAAASILAKVTRDHIMYELDKEYPMYNFKKNKGYGTKEHIMALKEYGFTKIHRKTYEPVKSMIREQLTLPI